MRILEGKLANTENGQCRMRKGGFERTSGFEAVTNFCVAVDGYVGDGGDVLGYVLMLDLAVTDPIRDSNTSDEK
ncbi:hypothetical protein AC249_AIPGENE12660 [Exaiptasia diaphana]|nr:hypothetical protein AC249_AIPGENE12660 [Exaiptasia diaphana]